MLGARSRRRYPTEESERQNEGGAPRRPVEADHAASVGGLVIPCKIAFQLRTATWDEALDRAAEGLRRAVERNPGWGAGVFSCSKATNEMIFVAQKFARQVLGTNNVDSCNRT